jgi:hypothetical protein
MEITDAKYYRDTILNEIVAINCTIDGLYHSVPIKVGNRHYDEIMRQVDAGTLTIADAD